MGAKTELMEKLLFEEAVDVLEFVECLVEIEFQFGDDSQLFAFQHAQATTQVGIVGVDGRHHGFFACGDSGIGVGHCAQRQDAHIDASYGEVGSDANFCYGDERVAQLGFHLFEKEGAHILLYETGYLVLSCCFHNLILVNTLFGYVTSYKLMRCNVERGVKSMYARRSHRF